MTTALTRCKLTELIKNIPFIQFLHLAARFFFCHLFSPVSSVACHYLLFSSLFFFATRLFIIYVFIHLLCSFYAFFIYNANIFRVSCKVVWWLHCWVLKGVQNLDSKWKERNNNDDDDKKWSEVMQLVDEWQRTKWNKTKKKDKAKENEPKKCRLSPLLMKNAKAGADPSSVMLVSAFLFWFGWLLKFREPWTGFQSPATSFFLTH